ncbi:MAG: imidazoleglycerol-phosphate dehydratase HisB [Candidatus Auribacter fodinae]|jgi:imidazoleglycerol-phosphate dehydratase|uniref:Imidazoleglycerol-phosphate dehydratase n=1 Tax=Candidatus Auribacter fodinae TaxID=2093366 RepID=A0A3A4QVF2_9BACT|nr:MAG: imidazoleglycerol-phosphate dehydratase HisB [Candidatus Auribacter fodinae]
MTARQADIARVTKETNIKAHVQIDGTGDYTISTGIPFFDHMLELFTKHGLFTLTVKAVGDVDVDYHHTVEDTGIALGDAFNKALGDRKGIVRYGIASVPMDEARVEVAVDLGGRPFVVYNIPEADRCIKDIPMQLFEEFLRGFAISCKMNIHVRYLHGVNTHHIIESMFKSFARAMDQACSLDTRLEGKIPSTKGVL